MKNLSCDIIADLLPLYADDKCSEYTKKYIIHHTENCPSCRSSLSDMTAEMAGTNTVEISDTKSVDSKIRTVFFKKFIIITCAIMMSINIILGVLSAIFIDKSLFSLYLIFCYNTLVMCVTMYLSFISRYKVLYVLVPFIIVHLLIQFVIYGNSSDLTPLMFYAPPILGTIAGKIAKR